MCIIFKKCNASGDTKILERFFTNRYACIMYGFRKYLQWSWETRTFAGLYYNYDEIDAVAYRRGYQYQDGIIFPYVAILVWFYYYRISKPFCESLSFHGIFSWNASILNYSGYALYF